MATITIIPESIKLLRISDEEYFSENYRQYISNSKLSLINPDEGGSVEKYNAGFQEKFSDSFELGSAVHAMILQQGCYQISKITKPAGKLGIFADKVLQLADQFDSDMALYKQASIEADYYANKFSDTRIEKALEVCHPYWAKRQEDDKVIKILPQIYLSESNLFKAEQCISSLHKNKQIMEALSPSSILGGVEVFNEYTLIADIKVEIDGVEKIVHIKGKLDNFTINHETQEITLNDLKTTGKPAAFFMGNWVNVEEGGEMVRKWFPGSFQIYHYYRQMGMYLWLLSCYYRNQGIDYQLKANMILVETFPNFQSRICRVYNRHIQQGLDEFKKLIINVVECTEN